MTTSRQTSWRDIVNRAETNDRSKSRKKEEVIAYEFSNGRKFKDKQNPYSDQ